MQYHTLEMWSLIYSGSYENLKATESCVRPHFERTDKGKQHMYSYLDMSRMYVWSTVSYILIKNQINSGCPYN